MPSGQTSARGTVAVLAPAVRSGLLRRVAGLVDRLEPDDARGRGLAALADLLPGRSASDLWLAFAAFSARFPRPTEVRRLRRVLDLDGGWAAIAGMLHALPHRYDPRFRPPAITYSDRPVVDVTGLWAEGVNSEGRETGLRLLREWDPTTFTAVTWAPDGRTLRGLDAGEAQAIGLPAAADGSDARVIIPTAGYALVGTADLPRNAERLIALGQYAGFPTASIGYGISPLLHGERYDTIEGAERFTWHLAAQRSFDHLVAVGPTTPQQYSGWKRMLTAVGIPGPEVAAVTMPESDAPADWARFSAECAARLGLA